MKLIYLKEGRNYSSDDLRECIKRQLKGDVAWLNSEFLEGLRDSINAEFKKTVVKGTKGSKFVFHYLGLYDYVNNKSGKNLTFFFVPKFVDFQEGTDCNYDEDHEEESVDKESAQSDSWNDRIKQFDESERNAVLLAIDRYNKEQSLLAEQMQVVEKKRESLLELAVRVLRDYLENGQYTVQRHELEHNGQGEINWNTTIEQFQPVIVRDRPYYMDVMTEQAYSDEDHYITRLHKCLITIWGRKLEELGLSSVLRVNVSPLSEEELDHFGDADYQIAQINKELNVQFITKARETLKLMKELIQRSTENRANNYESLSFGMTGVEHLWETACAEVLGTELEKKIRDCGFPDGPEDVTFSKYMPRVFWTNLVPAEDGKDDSKEFNLDKGSQRSKKAGWRLDFIRTYRPFGRVEKLVILDSKYYCARWSNGSISGQPGTPDIAKQMFYQMAFEDLIQAKKIGFVNAFLLPEDDKNPRYNLGKDIKISETVVLKSRQKGSDKFERAKAFKGINLFAVRIPGIRLLDRYANWEIADDWFEKIVSEAPKGEEENSGGTDAPDTPDGAEKKDDDTEGPKVPTSAESNQAIEKQDTSEGGLSDNNQAVPPESTVDGTDDALKNTGEPVLPIKDDCISKEFIRDVMSIPSCSGREEMMKEYIIQFAQDRGIAVEKDVKGNLYLTKGTPKKGDGYYPCLVNHMDTVQDKHLPYIERKERLAILERPKGPGQTEFYVNGMGIGADDKSGCAIALALVDQLQVVKAAFFVEEEWGMAGSKKLNVDWFTNVGFCLSFDSPGRSRTSETCAGERLYSIQFFNRILKPICDRHGITQFKEDPFTDVVQIRQKTPIMCYNVGNGGSDDAHGPRESLIVEDTQAAYKFGFKLLSEIGEKRYWFGDEESDDSGGGDPPKSPDQPVAPVSEVFEGTGDSDLVPSTTPDVCTCRMEVDAFKAKTAELDSSKMDGDPKSGSTVDATTDTARTQIKERQIMPGLKIYHGSRIEDLAEKALAELASDGRGPFEKSCVIVSNPLRAQWLKRCALLDGMAGGRKIFANVEFRTIEQFVSEAARAIRPTDSLSPDMSTLAMRIYALLADVAFLHEEAMSIPRAYLLKSGSIDIARTYALAREIAKLFAKYQVYRPEMLRSWEDSPETKSPDAIWQSAIWRQLHLQMKERGEQTVNDVLFELGRLTDEDRATALKRGRQGYRSVIVFDVPQIPSAYQDFLTALGEQGAVSSYEVECRLDCGVPAISPEEGVELQIHGCYMPRRELEAIRNGLYDWFEKGQKRTESGAPEGASVHRPRTALVLCADFANYAPVLESVFGVDAEKGELKIAGIGSSIPVKVVGRVARGGGALCETFMTLFDMPESRFTCSELMNILEQPSVFARFGFDDEDRRFVRSMVQNGNIRWGYDDAHVRKILELEPESTRTFPFTWRRGIDRMLLGTLEGSVGGDDFGVVHVGAARFIKPNSRIHGEQARRAAKLDRFLEVLNGIRNELPKSRTADGWSDYLHGIVDCCFLRVDEQSGRMIAAMHRAIESAVECLREISKGDVDAQHPFALLRDTVTAKLEDISLDAARRRTVANAVVFAPLAVGAAFPADLVWICGLNNAAFPRKSTPRAFDLMGQVPAVGDPSPRNDDRIAFCEAVRCARSRLALSFQSRDARTNKEFPPSVFVAELEDKVGAGNIRFLWHSLHGFNPRYFKPGSGLSSWSEEDYMAACAAQGRTQAIEEEGTVQAFSLPDGGTTVDAPVEIDLDDFCSYCYNPDRFIRERVLDATREGDVGAAFDDSEEFFRKQLDLGALKGRWSTLESVADLATRYGEMDDAHIERFVASLQEEGLVADDYDVNMTKDALKGVWRSGAELRTLPIKELGGRTALQALAEQGYNPDYVDVRTPVLKLEGQLDGEETTIYCRLVGQIPVVPKTKVHLQKALTGKPPVWDRARMAVYRTLADEYKINVKLYEVLPQAMPLVESTKVLSDLYEDAPDFEELLYEAFGMLRTPADEQEA